MFRRTRRKKSDKKKEKDRQAKENIKGRKPRKGENDSRKGSLRWTQIGKESRHFQENRQQGKKRSSPSSCPSSSSRVTRTIDFNQDGERKTTWWFPSLLLAFDIQTQISLSLSCLFLPLFLLLGSLSCQLIHLNSSFRIFFPSFSLSVSPSSLFRASHSLLTVGGGGTRLVGSRLLPPPPPLSFPLAEKLRNKRRRKRRKGFLWLWLWWWLLCFSLFHRRRREGRANTNSRQPSHCNTPENSSSSSDCWLCRQQGRRTTSIVELRRFFLLLVVKHKYTCLHEEEEEKKERKEKSSTTPPPNTPLLLRSDDL